MMYVNNVCVHMPSLSPPMNTNDISMLPYYRRHLCARPIPACHALAEGGGPCSAQRRKPTGGHRPDWHHRRRGGGRRPAPGQAEAQAQAGPPARQVRESRQTASAGAPAGAHWQARHHQSVSRLRGEDHIGSRKKPMKTHIATE